ncbi:serine hydrolase [Streptomyces sp. NPDC092296]|uniref:serine hydrolase n=1 Tax=Streptomyces sp. NPDC092296 TaxID=3366012 RepID=UPI0037F6A830
MRPSLRRTARRTAPAALVLALLPLAIPAPAAAAGAAPGICTSTARPELAAKLDKDIRAALAGRSGTVSVGLWDRATGTWCGVGYTRHYDSASVVKATLMAAVLHRAQELCRGLTKRENTLVTAMITKSDNNAASTLWRSLGRKRVQRFLKLAGLTHTTPGAGSTWGLTRITAQDELRVLALLDSANPVLTAVSRRYAMSQLARVVPAQRWGTPAGAPAGVGVHVKNGWLPRATHGWRVHSIGTFTRPTGLGYRLVVLTQDNRTMSYGVATIERVSRAVHRDLATATRQEPDDDEGTPSGS